MATLVIQVKVKTRAKESELCQTADGTWTARLKAQPVDGKANDELVGLVAKKFHCPKAAVTIKSGAASRIKLIRIEAP